MAEKIRIARNALILYVRTILCMVIGIFSVRVLLQTLGVDDYGLLAVVGSLAGALSLVIGGVSIAVSRFITFEYGRGDSERMRKTFSSAFFLFAFFSAIIVILGETVGVYLVSHQLVLPPGREKAAMWVFQFGIITVIAELFAGPYRASVIARERFDILAGIEIASAVVRLGLIYLISLSDGDRLILYGALTLLFPIGSLIFYVVYCHRRYPEVRMTDGFDLRQFGPVLKFASWEIVGMLSRTLKSTGFNMVVNFFCGVAINAAIGIANTLCGSINGLAYTVTGAFYPNMVKSWARNDRSEFESSVFQAMQISMLLYAVLAVPFIVECDYVLKLWLTDVPPLSSALSNVFVFSNLMLMPFLVSVEALKSTGVNRAVNLLQLFAVVLFLGLTYLALLQGFTPLYACIIFSLEVTGCALATFVIIGRMLGYGFLFRLLRDGIAKVLLAGCAVYLLLHYVSRYLEESFFSFVIVCSLSVVSFIAISPLLIPAQTRRNLLIHLRSRIGFLRNSAA